MAWIEGDKSVECIKPEKDMRQIIESLIGFGSAEYVRIVRCKDCKYGNICLDADGHKLVQCMNDKFPGDKTFPLELDWYCAGGERRESE